MGPAADDTGAEQASRPTGSLAPSLAEMLGVTALLLGLAFYGRTHFGEGNPRDDLLELLFYGCVFGGATVVGTRLHALLARRRLRAADDADALTRSLARSHQVGYAVLATSVVVIVVVSIL